MHRFRLIQVPSPSFDRLSQPQQWEADRLDYIDAIRQVMRAPLNPQAGVQIEEMEKSIRVLRALDGKKINDILELEDADWNHLCDKVRAARWAVVDERLVVFAHTILKATESVLEETSDGTAGRLERGDSYGPNRHQPGSTTPYPADPALWPGRG